MGTITLGEVKNRIRGVMNEKSINGELIGATDENRLDYDLRMNSLIDMHQREIATSLKKISRVHRFTQFPPTNTIANPLNQFDIVQFTGTTLYFQGSTKVKSYCVKVDGSCTITLQQSSDGVTYTDLETVSVAITTYGKFETFKSNLTPTTGYYVRMKIEGTYTFNIRSIALYDASYPTDNDIPVYEDFRGIAMPSDYYNLHYIVLNGQRQESKRYLKTSEFEQEGRTSIYLPWSEKGEYRIYYWAYPTKIDDNTSDSVTLDVDDEAIDAIVYGVAMDLIDDERSTAYSRIQVKYSEFTSRLSNGTATGGTTISNTLFSSSTTNKLF